MRPNRPILLLLAVLLSACATIQPAVPTPSSSATPPAATPSGQPAATSEPSGIVGSLFREYYDTNDGAHLLGPPTSAVVWLDGQPAQFFARGRLMQASDRSITQHLYAADELKPPPDALGAAASPLRATMLVTTTAQPLLPLPLALQVPGYSGPLELRVYDGSGQPAGAWQIDVRDGTGSAAIEGRGALGSHSAVALIDGAVAGVASNLFELDAETTLETGQPRFDQLLTATRDFLAHDVVSYELDGVPVRGYRSPDSDLLWLRDHTYQARGFRYFEHDVTSLIDAFRHAQRADGSFPDWLPRPEAGIAAGRKEVEADVEYLFVQAVYEAWQATGDDEWLRSNLDAMRRAVRYTMSDPLRWDAQYQLVKRPYTIDTWDFSYGPTTINPDTGRPAPRHWIDDSTIWGIFHGDNTGLAHSLQLLARIEERVGDKNLASEWRSSADGVMDRLNKLSWNGKFYTHFVPLQPFEPPGADTARQLSLSNTYALNRDVLRERQGRSIVEEYFKRGSQRGDTFAEWYSIDPPFPAGSFGMAEGKGENPGEYVNGGIMPLVGGELARGAFRYGAERYAFEILARYYFLVNTTGASYLWYYPAGNPGKSGLDTISTDGWGASAMLGALIEGAAGIQDDGARYEHVTLSPRWSATDDVTAARAVARYAASDGYSAYRWEREPQRIRLNFTGSGQQATVRILLPDGVKQPATVTLDGRPVAFEREDAAGSHYLRVVTPAASGVIEVGW